MNDFFYLRHYLASDVNLLFRMEGLKVPLKVTNRLFISRLKLTVVLVILLHGIVSEVNEFVFYIICVILLTGSANVRIFIEIPLHLPVYASQKSVTSEIEFSAVDEQGVVDVLLNDPTLWLATLPLLVGANKLLDFRDGGAEVDSVSSVRILSRFHYPDRFWHLDAGIYLFENRVSLVFFVARLLLFFLIVGPVSVALVDVLELLGSLHLFEVAHLFDFPASNCNESLLLFLFFLNFSFELLVVLLKPLEVAFLLVRVYENSER